VKGSPCYLHSYIKIDRAGIPGGSEWALEGPEQRIGTDPLESPRTTVHTTSNVHVAAGARLAGQLLSSRKPALGLSVKVFALASPVLVTVTTDETLVEPTCTLPKSKVLVDSLKAACCPCPVSVTVFVPALVTAVNTPLLGPRRVGVNTSLMLQLLDAAMLAGIAPQSWAAVKGPVVVAYNTVKATLPVLFKETDCGADEEATGYEPKLRVSVPVEAADSSPKPVR